MKHLTLISFIFFIGSWHYMQQEFPIERPESENMTKINLNANDLRIYYTEMAHHKHIDSIATIGENANSYIKHLKNYYYADFLFIITYSILFFLIASSLYRSKEGKLKIKTWYNVVIAMIALLFISDVGENWLMINFINGDFVKSYTIGIPILNMIKTVLFIILVYYLVIYHIKYVVMKFYSLL